ncbi:MAG: hypothetical protein EOP04_07695 [Proteobacteria bacterium]|nr:MAG: hypothetical protein EOP04_07695 [Pseudomonadota bacterium]
MLDPRLKKDEVKAPHYFRFRDRHIFVMAGLWQEWTGPDSKTGEKVTINTFTIITALPIEIVKDVHDRSPVILARDAEAAWLDPSISSDEPLELLNPYENYEEMEVLQVGCEVGNVHNDFPALIEPVEEGEPE